MQQTARLSVCAGVCSLLMARPGATPPRHRLGSVTVAGAARRRQQTPRTAEQSARASSITSRSPSFGVATCDAGM